MSFIFDFIFLGGWVHSEAKIIQTIHLIVRWYVLNKTRIVWAIFGCHQLAIILVDFFFARKMLGSKNENAGK